MEPRTRDDALWRTAVIAKHLRQELSPATTAFLRPSLCLAYAPPEFCSEEPAFDKLEMRILLDGHDLETRDYIFDLMAKSDLFVSKRVGDRVFLSPDFNQPMDEQREKNLGRLLFLLSKGVFKGWYTDLSYEGYMRRLAIIETLGYFDHSLVVKLGVHFNLWGTSIKFLGTKRHHDKWLELTENFIVQGCFALSELGHGSNVRGIETMTTYDAETEEFVIETPSESAQKYWIGGAAKHATHAIVLSHLIINERNEGIHAFVCELRDAHGQVCPGLHIADCGHKIGLNGVDNGRIWFDKVRVPRENLLNAISDVTTDGQYVSSIKDPDQRFGLLMAPLTNGRVAIAASGLCQARVGLATTIRYALTRGAFSFAVGETEVLLLDYPSHQHRLLPLLAKTYAMSFAAVELKKLYTLQRPKDIKTIHVLSSGFKAMFTWHTLRTLQECREACGGQGLKTENRVGHLKAEYDVQLTFEGDNNVLMQQVSKELLNEYLAFLKKGSKKDTLLDYKNDLKSINAEELNTNLLRDGQFQMTLFKVREQRLLKLLATHVTKFMSKGLSKTNAINKSYQLAENLGRAFSERSVLESVLRVEEQTTSQLKEVLGLLRTLYVLSAVDEDTTFLRYGFLSPKQSQLIHNEVPLLCDELRPQALNLVEAFGIPQSYLGPIADDWIEYNSLKHAY